MLKTLIRFIFSIVVITLASCKSGDPIGDDSSAPVITSIEPSSGSAGDTITINGDHFTGKDQTIAFFDNNSITGAVPNCQAEIISISKQVMKVKVPTCDMFHNVFIQVKRGMLSSGFPNSARFIVNNPYWDVLPGVNINTKGVVFSIGSSGYILNPYGSFYAFNTSTKTYSTLTQIDHADLLRYSFATDTEGIVVLDTSPYEVWAYDPSNDTWTQKSNCPYHLYYGSFSFRIGSKVYMSGGSNHEFISYDGATDTWVKLADYPGINGEGASAVAVNGVGYCFQGGWDFIQEAFTYTSLGHFNGCWKYDPGSDKWTAIADLPDEVQDRCFGIAVPVGDKIYFGAAYSQVFADIKYLDFMYEYSTTTDTWQQSALWPYEGFGAGYGFYSGDKAYLLAMQGGTNLLVFKPNKN